MSITTQALHTKSLVERFREGSWNRVSRCIFGQRLYDAVVTSGPQLFFIVDRSWFYGVYRDAVAVLDGLGVERAHVYGHSLGGRIAQWVAADHPERVDRLVLGATTVGDRTGVQIGRAHV